MCVNAYIKVKSWDALLPKKKKKIKLTMQHWFWRKTNSVQLLSGGAPNPGNLKILASKWDFNIKWTHGNNDPPVTWKVFVDPPPLFCLLHVIRRVHLHAPPGIFGFCESPIFSDSFGWLFSIMPSGSVGFVSWFWMMFLV